MIVNDVAAWCKEVHFITRCLTKLLRVSYAHPRVVAGYHELQLAHTNTRLAYNWLKLYVEELAVRYSVEIPDLTEDDALPDLYRDFPAIVRFITGQLDTVSRTLRGEQHINIIPLSNTFTMHAEAKLKEAQFLLQQAIEDTTIKYDEGTIEVQPG